MTTHYTNMKIAIGISGSVFAALGVSAPTASDDTLNYIIKGVITIGLLAVAYLLKEVATTVKETNKAVIKHDGMLQLHNIMYEQWLNNLDESSLGEGRRATDKLLSDLLRKRGQTSTEGDTQ